MNKIPNPDVNKETVLEVKISAPDTVPESPVASEQIAQEENQAVDDSKVQTEVVNTVAVDTQSETSLNDIQNVEATADVETGPISNTAVDAETTVEDVINPEAQNIIQPPSEADADLAIVENTDNDIASANQAESIPQSQVDETLLLKDTDFEATTVSVDVAEGEIAVVQEKNKVQSVSDTELAANVDSQSESESETQGRTEIQSETDTAADTQSHLEPVDQEESHTITETETEPTVEVQDELAREVADQSN